MHSDKEYSFLCAGLFFLSSLGFVNQHRLLYRCRRDWQCGGRWDLSNAQSTLSYGHPVIILSSNAVKNLPQTWGSFCLFRQWLFAVCKIIIIIILNLEWRVLTFDPRVFLLRDRYATGRSPVAVSCIFLRKTICVKLWKLQGRIGKHTSMPIT